MFNFHDGFSPWTLLSELIAWILLAGLATMFVAAMTLTLMAVYSMYQESRKDKDVREMLKHPENDSRSRHPAYRKYMQNKKQREDESKDK